MSQVTLNSSCYRACVLLDQAPAGTAARVVRASVGPELGRRLAELGIRPGEAVTPLHSTAGGGRVLAVGDTRIALARSVLRSIEVESA